MFTKKVHRNRSNSMSATMKQVGWKSLIIFAIILTIIFNIGMSMKYLGPDNCQTENPVHRKRENKQTIIKDVPIKNEQKTVSQNLLFTPEVDVIFSLDTRLGQWDSRKQYKMFNHVLVGARFQELSNEYSVCLATQSSLEKLYSIVQVAIHWSGPISAALFAAGDEEYILLQEYVDFLRKCYPDVREKISFHLAFPKEKIPKNVFVTPKIRQLDCRRPEAALGQILKSRSMEIIRWRVRNPYPQNHLRNLARKNCETTNVFLTDIDIIPSINMADGLDLFLKTFQCVGLCAYVIPTYELDERVPFPRNKSELIRLTKKGLSRPFHNKVFIYNQFATNFSKWEKDTSSAYVDISHPVTNFEFLYEPFYVGPDTTPPHDERFVGYGFTRNTQVYEMYVAGYQFFVLTPIFTVHWGLQNRKNRPSWREKQNSNNRKNLDQFKREVFAKYQRDPLNMMISRDSMSSLKLNA